MQDLHDHEQQHHSSVQMLQAHKAQLEELKGILGNASKVLSVHLEKAQERERNGSTTDIAQRLESSMEQEVQQKVEAAMTALEERMAARMDRVLAAASKRLAETATEIARNAITKEVNSAMEIYMKPPYTPGMVNLVQREVCIELDSRLESAVLKQVDNVTAGVVDGLSWKQSTGVNVIDLDATVAAKAEESHPSGFELQAANASRFQRKETTTTTTTTTATTTTSPPIHVERMDGYIAHPQIDPVTNTPMYSYDDKNEDLGPSHWGEIDPAYRKCGSGKHQSPIDVRTSKGTSMDAANVRYDPYLADLQLQYDAVGPLVLQNMGHVVNIPVNQNNDTMSNNDNGIWSLTHGTRTYTLDSITFHVSGEHTFNGKKSDMEMHLRHRAVGGTINGAARNIVVLVVPFFQSDDEERGDNFLDLFWDDIPPAGEQQVLDATSLNLVAAIFPSPTGSRGDLTQVKITSDAFYA